ncbi:MAG TPA: SEC-C domain-containing protein [Nannocystaceae bacterium]|nr:SEC-C domain-containing protein [Nannocystaceae bacterium]
MSPDDDRFHGRLAALLAGPSLDLEAREQIVAQGDAMVPRLLAILQDDELAHDDSPGDGYAPLHAAMMLADIRAASAIAPMLARFAAREPDDPLFEMLAVVMPRFGADLLEPALAAHDATDDLERRDYYCEFLAKSGARDERIFSRLIEVWERLPDYGTGLLGNYGDPAGLPWVQREFDRVTNADDRATLTDLLGAAEALDSLGALTPAHEEIVARAKERVHGPRLPPLVPAAQVLPARRRERPGRNEPCWCGSGKKYKRCHADADERDERAELDDAVQGAPDGELAQALIELGGEELEDFHVGEELERERMVELLMVAWNIASFEEIGNHDAADELRAEIARMGDVAELREYVEDMVEARHEEWEGDTRFVMSARVIDGTLVVEGGEADDDDA